MDGTIWTPDRGLLIQHLEGVVVEGADGETQVRAIATRLAERFGEDFDRGETFSGVDYETGLNAVEELRVLVPEGMTMAQFALRWILMFDAVSCAIPGAKNRSQAVDNARSADLPALSADTMAQVKAIYDELIKEQVHQRW